MNVSNKPLSSVLFQSKYSRSLVDECDIVIDAQHKRAYTKLCQDSGHEFPNYVFINYH